MILDYKRFVESVIVRDKGQEIFDYKYMIQNAWREVVREAMDFYNIHFDLENDSSTGTKKTIYVPKNLRKDQPIKYEFNVECFRAGGDWEMPVLYFRVEFTHDYGVIRYYKNRPVEHVFDIQNRNIEKNKHLSEMSHKYVLIPDVENGNFLVKDDKVGYRAYTDEDLKREGLDSKDVKPDEKKAWKWIEELLIKLVDERHEMLDDDKRELPSPDAPKDVQLQVQPQSQPNIVQNNPNGVEKPVQNIDPVEPKLPEGPAQLISQ